MIRFRFYKDPMFAPEPLFSFDCYRHHKSHPYRAFSVAVFLRSLGIEMIVIYKNYSAYKRIWKKEFE